MTTQECHEWLKRRREQLEPVDRSDISLEDLFREEELRRERIGLLLTERYADPRIKKRGDKLDDYLIHERLLFSERLAFTMLIPYSPCRVRDWENRRNLWWLLGVSWIMVGVEQWQERERLRASFPPNVRVE